jgi:hypothetical protein
MLRERKLKEFIATIKHRYAEIGVQIRLHVHALQAADCIEN